MKKFIIAICGILVVTGAMAAPDRYREPEESPYAEQYLSTNSSPYTVSITGLYPKLSEQIGPHDRFQNGTHNDEGAIVIWAARDIYEHGVNICPVQIQAANQNFRRYTWIDYHWKDDWQCKTFCYSGYSGSKCTNTSLTCPATKTIEKVNNNSLKITLTSNYILQNLPNLIDGTPGDRYQHTKDMRVLNYANEKIADGGDTNDTKQANHIVLGVTGRVANGVWVEPVKIVAQRRGFGTGINSYIVSAYSNGDKVLLCTGGYVPNKNNTECVKNPQCDDISAVAAQNWDWCSNYVTGFDEEQHDIKPNQSKKCNEYRCISDNYGFKSSSDHTCVACGTDAKAGIFNGVCKTCSSGQVFDEGAPDGCRSAKHYSQKQMREGNNDSTDKKCWLESEPDSFCKCVTGKVCSK